MRHPLIEHYPLDPEMTPGILIVPVKIFVRVKIVKTPHGKKMPMCGINERVVTAEERDNNLYKGSVLCDPMEFLYHFYDIVQMLHDIVGLYIIELIIGKSIRQLVQIVYHIGIRIRRDIYAYRTFQLSLAAPQVQHFHMPASFNINSALIINDT